MNREILRAWEHVERAVGKRYPEIRRLMGEREAPVTESEIKQFEAMLAKDLYRLARDIEESNHQVSKFRRLFRMYG